MLQFANGPLLSQGSPTFSPVSVALPGSLLKLIFSKIIEVAQEPYLRRNGEICVKPHILFRSTLRDCHAAFRASRKKDFWGDLTEVVFSGIICSTDVE